MLWPLFGHLKLWRRALASPCAQLAFKQFQNAHSCFLIRLYEHSTLHLSVKDTSSRLLATLVALHLSLCSISTLPVLQPTLQVISVVKTNRMSSASSGLLGRLTLNNPFILLGIYGVAFDRPIWGSLRHQRPRLSLFPAPEATTPSSEITENVVPQQPSSIISALGRAKGGRSWGLQWLLSLHLNPLEVISKWTLPLSFKQCHYTWVIFFHEWVISRKYKKQFYDQMQSKSYDCCPWFKRSRNPLHNSFQQTSI